MVGMDAERVTVDVVRDHDAGIVRIRVTGAIDEPGALVLRRALNLAASQRPTGVEIDMGAVTFFSCAGIAALVAAHKATRGRIALVNASAPVLRLLDVVVLPPFDDMHRPTVDRSSRHNTTAEQ
jgi:anti-anti-sigma factor